MLMQATKRIDSEKVNVPRSQIDEMAGQARSLQTSDSSRALEVAASAYQTAKIKGQSLFAN